MPIDEQNNIVEKDFTPQEKRRMNHVVIRPVSGIVFGASAATAANYGTFFVADKKYVIVGVVEEHNVAGNDAGAVTLSVEKCGTGVAPGSGLDILTTAFNLRATANTPQFGALITIKSSLSLKKGDRLVLKDTGTLTNVSHVCVTVYLYEL